MSQPKHKPSHSERPLGRDCRTSDSTWMAGLGPSGSGASSGFASVGSGLGMGTGEGSLSEPSSSSFSARDSPGTSGAAVISDLALGAPGLLPARRFLTLDRDDGRFRAFRFSGKLVLSWRRNSFCHKSPSSSESSPWEPGGLRSVGDGESCFGVSKRRLLGVSSFRGSSAQPSLRRPWRASLLPCSSCPRRHPAPDQSFQWSTHQTQAETANLCKQRSALLRFPSKGPGLVSLARREKNLMQLLSVLCTTASTEATGNKLTRNSDHSDAGRHGIASARSRSAVALLPVCSHP